MYALSVGIVTEWHLPNFDNGSPSAAAVIKIKMMQIRR